MICISDDDDCEVEPMIIDEHNKCNKENYVNLCNKIYQENQLLAQFIEKCLNLENTEVMLKTIKNVLLHRYYKVDKSVRESTRVKKAIERANNLIKANPHYVYSHIKDLCNILEIKPVKRKVPFITLATNLNKNGDSRNNFGNLQINQEGHKMDVINIDSGDEETDNTCDESTDICAHESSHETESVCVSPTKSKKPKLDTEIKSHNSVPIDNNDLNGNIVDRSNDIPKNESSQGCSTSESFEEDKLLIPKKVIAYEPCPSNNEEEIKKIEEKIASYKEEIARLDEEEVGDDSVNSPYIKSERLKAAIVLLYKDLCRLTGEQAVKRREIRLQVIDGHPQGPTKVLESFLNKNIGPDGDPPFPDFCDVVSCVTKANEKDNLGWSRAQIVREASLLFTQCGTALQKRRQNREWRDLLRRVKCEDSVKDPAEDDPALLARLEENKRIAQKKEKEILERYTMMQFLPPQPKVNKNKSSDTPPGNNTSNELNLKTDLKCSSQIPISQNSNVDREDQITAVSSNTVQGINYNLANTIDNKLTSNTTDSNQTVSPNRIGNIKMYDSSNSQNNSLDSDNYGNESYHEFVAREIKQEPEEHNVVSQLESLGNNFVVTVDLIEDSILTIEVSSDSSDEE